MRKLSALLIGSMVYFFTCASNSTSAHAATMNSESFTIRLGNFNMTSGLKSSASYSLTDTVGQIAAEFFAGNGYHVKTGFQYIYTLYDFSFTISSLLIDLGDLTPGSFGRAKHDLIVTAPGQGYSVSAHARAPLKNENGDVIEDTACDSGCTESNAGIWINPASRGFGYNAVGNDVSTDFVNNTLFRPFPDISKNESPATVMITDQAGKNRTATVTYQAAISASQPGGNYATQIVYIATPVY